MMRQRKITEVSRPTVIIRKKKPQPTTTVVANSGQSTASAPQAPRPVPRPTTKPSPQRTVSPPVQTQAQLTQQPLQATPPQPNHRQRDAQAQKELLEVFRARWPAVFPYDRQYLRPLMRGVHHEIAKHLVGTSLSLIKRTIVLFQRHSGGGYWRAVLKGGPRYALDGSPCGEVTPHEQEHAQQTLAALAQQREAKRQDLPVAAEGDDAI